MGRLLRLWKRHCDVKQIEQRIIRRKEKEKNRGKESIEEGTNGRGDLDIGEGHTIEKEVAVVLGAVEGGREVDIEEDATARESMNSVEGDALLVDTGRSPDIAANEEVETPVGHHHRVGKLLRKCQVVEKIGNLPFEKVTRKCPRKRKN